MKVATASNVNVATMFFGRGFMKHPYIGID